MDVEATCHGPRPTGLSLLRYREQPHERLTALGDDHLITFDGLVDQSGEVRFGLMNIDDGHGLSLV